MSTKTQSITGPNAGSNNGPNGSRTFLGLEYKYIVAIVFVIGLFMDILDTTIVNVANPALQKYFNASNTSIEWVITGYLLSLAVFIPASGWIGDRFGTKRTFLFALFAFTGASMLCGVASSLNQLIVFRALQGVGGGMLTPVGTAMLFRAFKPEERAKASGILTIPTVVAPATGPVLGGFLVDHASWRWIFWVNVPVGILGFIFGWLFLREHTEPTAGGFDAPGFIFSGAGLFGVLYALSQGPDRGWLSAAVLVPGLIGIACFVVLAIVETRTPSPMLDLKLLKNRLFRSANIASAMSSAGLLGLLFLLPQFLQILRGLSAFQSGLTTFPQAIAVMIFAKRVAKWYPKIGPRRLLAVGLTGTAVLSGLFMLFDASANQWAIRALMFGRGIFFAMSIVSLQAASFATIRPQDTGRASSLFSTTRQVGSALGVAILATVLASRKRAHNVLDRDVIRPLFGLRAQAAAAAKSGNLEQAKALSAKALDLANKQVPAYRDAFLVAVILGLIGVGFALLINDDDALASMRKPAQQPEKLGVSAT
jgi:EmrB/QacA subfamily drug resistance transporter